MNKLQVQVPATSANCGPGFDCMGIALELFNTFTFTPDINAREFTYSFEGFGAELLAAEDQEKNLTGMAMREVFHRTGKDICYGHVHSNTEIPPSRGLGSSSTAIVAGLIMSNRYLGDPLTKSELLRIANEIEGHPDNVCPALFGNLCCAVKGPKDVQYTYIAVPDELVFAVAVPEVLVSTEFARAALPAEIPFRQAVANVGCASLFVSSMVLGKLENLRIALHDYLHVPYRKELIPHCEDVFSAAVRAGAYGATISGSGSTLIGYCNIHNVSKVSQAMEKVFSDHAIACRSYVLKANKSGARLI